MFNVMDASPLSVSQLIRCQPAAWTALLQQDEDLNGISVRDVRRDPAGKNGATTRYLLKLAGHSDAISLVAKKTNQIEARFYNELAEYVPGITPNCWLSHCNGSRNWVVLDDVPNHRPGPKWSGDDVESIVTGLVTLHSTFWELAPYLAGRGWLPAYLAQPEKGSMHRGYYELLREHSTLMGLGQAATVSAHAMQVAGRLAPTFVRIAAGLEVLLQLGGWPGVIEEKHLETVGELLDDPLPVLQPLRELPVTVLHGHPAPDHWRVTLFNERYLLDWEEATIGPPVCDLVTFLEQARILWTGPEGPGYQPVSEETMIDSYILRMSVLLGQGFPARAVRRAMPAALCLHVLTAWLPRFADWFHPYVGSPYTWEMITNMNDRQLDRAGLPQLKWTRPYLKNLFRRFRKAYTSL
jgi:hypothetical protein